MENQENKNYKNIQVDRKSKILFSLLGILIIVSAGLAYYRYIVKKDYIIEAQIDCDPETENCFIWKCDPTSLTEGEECTGVPDNDIWYYKIFRRNAQNIPLCDPKDENCTVHVCSEGEKDCADVLCTPQNVKKGEECNDPVKYLEENPPADENSTDSESEADSCAPDDQECLDAQLAECDPASEDCPGDTSQQECAPGDENCATAPPADENVPASTDEISNQAP
jgi:hypothetical protein